MHTPQSDIKVKLKKVTSFVESLNRSQQLYLLGTGCLILFFVSLLTPFKQWSVGNIQVALFLYGCAIVTDLSKLYKKIWSTILGKAFIYIIFALCTNLSLGIANQIVNNALSAPPSNFIYTTSLISILQIPLLVSFGFFVMYFLLLLLAPLYFMHLLVVKDFDENFILKKLIPNEEIKFRITTFVVRVIVFCVVSGFVYSSMFKIGDKYEEKLTYIAQKFAYNFEFYKKSYCSTEDGEKIAHITNDIILVGREKNDGQYTFQYSTCAPSLNSKH